MADLGTFGFIGFLLIVLSVVLGAAMWWGVAPHMVGFRWFLPPWPVGPVSGVAIGFASLLADPHIPLAWKYPVAAALISCLAVFIGSYFEPLWWQPPWVRAAIVDPPEGPPPAGLIVRPGGVVVAVVVPDVGGPFDHFGATWRLRWNGTPGWVAVDDAGWRFVPADGGEPTGTDHASVRDIIVERPWIRSGLGGQVLVYFDGGGLRQLDWRCWAPNIDLVADPLRARMPSRT